jgi:hypothetical protein
VNNLKKIRELVGAEEAEDGAAVGNDLDDLYRKMVADHKERAKNFGIVSNREVLARLSDIVDNIGPRPKYSTYVRIISNLVADPSISELAQRKRDTDLFFSEYKDDTRRHVIDSLTRIRDRELILKPFLRSGRDPVMGADHHLPAEIRLVGAPYQEICRDITEYFRAPPQGAARMIRKIRLASKRFLDVDLQLANIDVRHELVRCLLFLSSPHPASDSVAREHAEEMLSFVASQWPSGGEAIEEIKGHFLYVLCWALRREKRFEEAEAVATKVIESEAGCRDARFFHGRAINAYSWLTFGEAPEGVTVVRAISDAERAIELYSGVGTGTHAHALAALYNTLTCFCSNWVDDYEDLPAARRFLDELKQVRPKWEWDPGHPEYFHTEAFLEFQEFRQMERARPSGRAELVAARDKLLRAHKEIERAIEIFSEDEDYTMLRRQIDLALTEVGRSLESTDA